MSLILFERCRTRAVKGEGNAKVVLEEEKKLEKGWSRLVWFASSWGKIISIKRKKVAFALLCRMRLRWQKNNLFREILLAK